MAQLEQVVGPERQARDVLADEVRHVLALAGLTVGEAAFSPSCVMVWVDYGADEAGGVFARWRPSEEMVQTVVAQRGEPAPGDPILQQADRVKEIMNEAIREVLALAGFAAESFQDDYVAPAVVVHGREGLSRA